MFLGWFLFRSGLMCGPRQWFSWFAGGGLLRQRFFRCLRRNGFQPGEAGGSLGYALVHAGGGFFSFQILKPLLHRNQRGVETPENVVGDVLCYLALIGVRSEIARPDHIHPRLAVLQQPVLERLPRRVL